MKKIISVLVAFVVVLGFVNPVSAATSITLTSSSTFLTGGQGNEPQMLDVPNVGKVVFHTYPNGIGGQVYAAAVVSPSGVLGQDNVITYTSGDAVAEPSMSVAVNEDGIIAVAIVTDPGDYSIIKFFLSTDGVSWDDGDTVDARVIGTPCNALTQACGFVQPKVSFDSDGNLNLFVAFSDGTYADNTGQLLAYSSINGKNWSTRAVATLHGANYWGLGSGWNYKTIETPKGLIVSWLDFDGVNQASVYAAVKPNRKYQVWRAPVQLVASSLTANARDISLFQSGKTEITATWWSFWGDAPKLKVATYNSATNVWSQVSNKLTCSCTSLNGNWDTGSLSASNANGTIMAWAENYGRIHVYGFGDYTMPDSYVIENSQTAEYELMSISLEKDNSFSVTAVDDQSGKAWLFETNTLGNTTKTEIPAVATGDINRVLTVESQNGDLTFYTQGFWADQNTNWHGVSVATRASAPVALEPATITGIAKKGKKLTAYDLNFGSVTGVTNNSYQWYSCKKQVKTVPLTLPTNCKPIAKATQQVLAVSAKLKKSFVLVKVSSTNALGTNQIFSVSTSAIK
jgi:hypothetical protein